jgi:hypothetical protein
MSEALYFAPLRVPLVDARTGLMSREWYLFFQALWLRTGGVSGSDDAALLQAGVDGMGSADLQALQLAGDQALAQAPALIQLVPENLEFIITQLGSLQSAVAVILNQLQDIKLAINTGN